MQTSHAVTTATITGSQLIEQLARRFKLVETASERLGPGDQRVAARFEPEADPIEVNLTYPDKTQAPALSADLSADGARLVADRMPSCGQVLCLSFDLGDRCLTLLGEVRHFGSEDTIGHFGVDFLDTSADRNHGA